MFALKRNQIILTALVAMVAVAGYLNFSEKTTGESGTMAAMTDESDSYGYVMSEGAIETLPDDTEIAQGETDPLTASADTEDDTGAAVFVNSETNAEAVETSTTTASTSTDNTYFIQAKLEREQARSKQKDILTEMINNENIEQTQKAECATNMLELQKRIEKETAAEAMIESKGFKEAYVRIDDETVDVVVEKSELTEQEVAQIMDIVKRKTGFTEDKIRISPLKQS